MMLNSATNPFVGLRPFESHESLLFFGRQDQTMELLQRLHQYHFVAVTGSSGSGKSSIIRAGLIPRLKAGYLVNDGDRWLISAMKPGQSPLYNLANAINTQSASINHSYSASELKQKIEEEGVDAILNILAPLWDNNFNFFLLVDQFEELFRFSLDEKNIERKDEAIDFVNILLELSKQTDLPIYVVITMRSDFIGDCALFYGLPEAMNQSQYIVPRLNRIQLETTIEGPVRLYNGKINSALTARLLNDTQIIKDKLPLLQHVLMRMWDRHKKLDKHELDLQDYENIGGIEKALSNHADEALEGMSEMDLILTKKIFQSLTGIDENARKIRRPVHLSELELITGADKEKLLSIINRFIEDNRCFIIINELENTDDKLIDISHESLIRQWGTLNVWVDEEAESAKSFLRLAEATLLYKQKYKNLLTGNELLQHLRWYHSFNPGKDWAKRYSPDFESSIQYLKESDAEEKKQRYRKMRNRKLLISATIAVLILISTFATIIYRNDLNNKRDLALNYWKSSHSARKTNNFLDVVHLIAEAAVITDDQEVLRNLLIDAESFLPRTFLENIFYQNDIINTVCFSSDGKFILIAGNDGSARILDKETGKQIGPDMKHESPVNSAVFSSDDSMILTTGNDSTARIWKAATGKQIISFVHESAAICGVFSPDNKWIFTGSSDYTARIWEISTGKLIASFDHDNEVLSVAFSNDKNKVLTACKDITPHLWNVVTRKEITFSDSSLSENGSIVLNAVFSHDGTKILTTSSDSTVRVLNLEGRQLVSLKHRDNVTYAVFSPNDRLVLTAGKDKSAYLWTIEKQSRVGTAMKHDGPVYSVAFSTDGKQILTAGWDKTIRLWDLQIMPVENKNITFKQQGFITTGTFSKDGTKILTAGYDSTARIWDMATRKQIALVKHNAKVNSAVFSNDGLKILTASDDSTVRIWEANTGKQVNFLKLESKVNSAAFSSDGKWIVTASLGSTVQIWKTESKIQEEPVHSFKFQYEINKAVFTKNNKYILIAGGDSYAHIFAASSGREIISFQHDDIVTDAVFSPDEKTVLTASRDNTAKVWNRFTGIQLGPSLVHHDDVSSAVYSSDGNWIVTAAGFINEVYLWNADIFREIGSAKKTRSIINGAVFSPDEKWILTAGRDSTATLWEIGGDLDLPPTLFKLQAEAVTGVTYNIVTGETECLSFEKWLSLKEQYNTQAKDHYKECNYPEYNLWHRFNKDDLVKDTGNEGQ